MERKTRPIPFKGPIAGRLQTWAVRKSDGVQLGNRTISKTSNAAAFAPLTGIQITESESHPEWFRRKSGKITGDLGGNFRMTIRRAEPSFIGSGHLEGWKDDLSPPPTRSYGAYDGPVMPLVPTEMQWPPFIYSSNDDLDEAGTTAIARCSPTNPTSDCTVFLGELLHEGLPSVVGQKLIGLRSMSNRQRRKAISGEFLNYQFGWLPFTKDLKDISKSVIHGDTVISQYERDSGKMVRRRYDFPTEESTTYSTVATGVNPWISPSTANLYYGGLVASGKVIRTHTTVRKRWFTGAFTYYIPSGGSTRERMQREVILAKKLLGVRLTPGAVWNLAPWSWAVDWFTNAGDVLKNFDAWAIDNQVLWYGYIMEHTISTYTYTFVGPTTFQSEHTLAPSISLICEAKIRRKATPYGFGIQWDGLSNLQKAIIAALGLSKF